MRSRLLVLFYNMTIIILFFKNISSGQQLEVSKSDNTHSMFDYGISSYYDYDDYDENSDTVIGMENLKIQSKNNSSKPYKNTRPLGKSPWFELLWDESRLFNPSKTSKNKTQSVELIDKIKSINKFIQDYILNKKLGNVSSTTEPTFEEIHTTYNFSSEVPKCKEKYCIDVPYYPRKAVIDVLKKNENVFLHNDQIVNQDVSLRMGISDDSNDVPLCESSEFLIYPKTAQNIYNEWFFIVNEGSYTQSIKVETCKQENIPCNVIEGFRLGYETYCKQRYIVRELITFNETGKLGKSSFRFPASCCCSARMNFFSAYRVGSTQDGSSENNETTTNKTLL